MQKYQQMLSLHRGLSKILILNFFMLDNFLQCASIDKLLFSIRFKMEVGMKGSLHPPFPTRRIPGFSSGPRTLISECLGPYLKPSCWVGPRLQIAIQNPVFSSLVAGSKAIGGACVSCLKAVFTSLQPAPLRSAWPME